MLLSVPSKVLSRIILERLKEMAETKLREEQAGFRKKQILHRPDSHTSHHSRAEHRMEFATLHQLRGLRKGI